MGCIIQISLFNDYRFVREIDFGKFQILTWNLSFSLKESLESKWLKYFEEVMHDPMNLGSHWSDVCWYLSDSTWNLWFNFLLAVFSVGGVPTSLWCPSRCTTFQICSFPAALPAITMHQTWISTGLCSTRGPCCRSTWSLPTSCSAKDFRPWCQLTTLWKEWVQETALNTILPVSNKN